MVSDYISREVAIEAMYKDAEANPNHTFWTSQFEALMDIPAADVRPVRRGKWIKCRKNYSKCSECGTAYSHPVDWTPDKYCSECGARLFMEN